MLNVNVSLGHFGISTTSQLRAVMDVRELVEKYGRSDSCTEASTLIHGLIDKDVTFTDPDVALITAQGIVVHAIKHEGVVDDADVLIREAQAHAAKLMGEPSKQWLFAKEETDKQGAPLVTAVEGVDVKVAVKTDGTIKKGGKEVLAKVMYEQYRASPTFDPANENQPFIAILMKELGMTKAGATTYNYNMKKAYNAAHAK